MGTAPSSLSCRHREAVQFSRRGVGGWWHVSWCTAGPPAWKPSCSLPPEGQALIRALLLGPARWLQAELGSQDSSSRGFGCCVWSGSQQCLWCPGSPAPGRRGDNSYPTPGLGGSSHAGSGEVLLEVLCGCTQAPRSAGRVLTPSLDDRQGTADNPANLITCGHWSLLLSPLFLSKPWALPVPGFCLCPQHLRVPPLSEDV